MPNYLIATGDSDGSVQAKNKTYYHLPMSYIYKHTSEAKQQILARDSYTLSKLYVYVSANTITDATTVVSRKNAANGNLTISIPASTTGAFTDAVNTDSLVDGDLFCTKVTIPDAGTSITFTIFSYILSTATNTTPILAYGGELTINANLTKYQAVIGGEYGTVTEGQTYYTFRVAATLSNLRVYVSYNAITAVSTLVTRINGSDGSQSVSIPASTTGGFEDTVNTDSISVGQNVNYQLTTGATGTVLAITLIQVKLNSAGRQVGVTYQGSTGLAFGTTTYITIEGSSQLFNTTEASVQATARAAFTAKNMYVNISVNSVDDSTSFILRKDTGNSGLTVSVPASTTGQFEDLVNTADYVAASLINWQVITGGTTGSIRIVCIGFELAQPAAPPPAAPKGGSMAAKMIAGKLI